MRPHRPPSWRLFYCPSQKGRTMTTATGAAAPKSSFWASGHWPTLVAAFLYFDLAFMVWVILGPLARSEEHTSELQSLMRISYAVFCLKKKKKITNVLTYHISY